MHDIPYIEVVYDIDFNEEAAEDITIIIKNRISQKYQPSIKKVLKYKKLYKIYFNFGYTAFLANVRYARHLGEVQWLSKIATEEQKYKYTLEHYIEEFKRNKINFDGKNIPIFIDTYEQIRKTFGIE